MKVALQLLLAVTSVVSTYGAASAQLLRTVALTGRPAPGIPGGSFDGFYGFSSINSSGKVAFWADGNGVPLIAGGVWSEGSGMLQLVAKDGDQVPGLPNATFDSVGSPNINAAGQIAFTVWIHGNGSNNRGWVVGTTGSLRMAMLKGWQAPGAPSGVLFGSNGQLELRRPPVLNSSGQIAFRTALTGSGVTAANNSGLWSEGGGALEQVIRDGEAAPGLPQGETVFDPFPPVLNSAGQVAFMDDKAVWFGSAGALDVVAFEGDQAPGMAAGFNYTDLRSPVLNSAGQVAFVSIVSDGSTNSMGIWKGEVGQLNLVVKSGDAAPRTPSFVTFSGVDLNGYKLNAAGELSFLGYLTGGGVDSSNNTGFWSEGFGALDLVAREGDHPPGVGTGIEFDNFGGQPSFNSFGQTAFEAKLRGAGIDTANDDGVWAQDRAGRLRLIVREGDQLEVAPGDFRTIEILNLGATSGIDSGSPSYFNDAGQIVFHAFFTDGSEGIFVSSIAAVPEHSSAVFVFLGMSAIQLAVRVGRQ
jgi:hypothetical protein